MMKSLRCLAGLSLVVIVLMIVLKLSSIYIFIVRVVDSPELQISFSGLRFSVNEGNDIFIIPVSVISESDFKIFCKNSSDVDGYIAPGLDTLVYVAIRSCKIETYRSFG